MMGAPASKSGPASGQRQVATGLVATEELFVRWQRRGDSRAREELVRRFLPLARKLTSVVGRVDYARVRVRAGRVEPLAVSGASILSSRSPFPSLTPTV